MSDQIAIAYTSEAVHPFAPRELDDLLVDARGFNERVRVGGALLHHQGRFFQYFEGAPDAMARVYQRIQASGKHHRLVELFHQPVQRRCFTRWHMGFAEAPASVLEEIANDDWAMKLPGLQREQVRPAGLRMLLDFWNASTHVSAPNHPAFCGDSDQSPR